VDCTNVNVEAVTKQCQPIDVDLDLAGGAGQLTGFAPTFNGFCTQLEQALNNQVSCDCTDAVGGTFALTCQSIEPVCGTNDDNNNNNNVDNNHQNPHCGHVKSTVEVVNGQMDRIISCSKYTTEPFAGGETCTGIQLCSAAATGDKDDTTTSTPPSVGLLVTNGANNVCGCWATYNGQPCNACHVCDIQEDDNNNSTNTNTRGLTLDCSNVQEHAIVEQCQPLTLATSYEFLPNYPVAAREAIGVAAGRSNGPSRVVTGMVGILTVATATASWIY
jgi:hypothetical protein